MTTVGRPSAPSAGWPMSEPKDMLAKVSREIARLVEAEKYRNTTHALDHALNAATTAILIVDWVWRSGGWDNAAIRTAAGLPAVRPQNSGREELRAFRRFVITQCPELGECLDVRDLLQHFELDNANRNPATVEASAAVTYSEEDRARMLANAAQAPLIRVFEWTVTVKWKVADPVTGQRRNEPAADVLNRIVACWERIFDRFGIAR